MKKSFKTKAVALLSASAVAAFAIAPLQSLAVSAQGENTVFINEIESNDAAKGNDWIEIINIGTSDIDISGWFVSDDKGLERLTDGSAKPLGEGTILKSGEILVLEETVDFDFGLGKADTAALYDKNGSELDSYSWTAHAAGTYSRIPDGTGEFADSEPTKGERNQKDEEITEPQKGELVLNEINSAPDDWVELLNIGDSDMDISGYEIRDNSDDHSFKFAEGTVIKSRELLLVTSKTAGLVLEKTGEYVEGSFEEAIGIGSGDSIRLFDKNGELLDSYSWTEHASVDGDASKASFGRYPDGTGAFALMPETPGEKNDWYKPEIVVNEIESNGDDTDWVEIYNAGKTSVDISGWYILDNDPVGHISDVAPLAEGTILKAGEFFVFEETKQFNFGLGKADSANLYNADGILIDGYSWSAHANGVYARIPDGTGEFVDFETATKGKANRVVSPVVINEVQSKDPDGGDDWIELANPTNDAIDISGIVVKDDDDTHGYTIPEGTVIEGNGFLVITESQFGFGLGKDDQVRLFENGELIAMTTWSGNTNPTWGLYPDAKGSEYRSTLKATPGTENKFEGIPDVIEWQGSDEVTVYDTEQVFLEDSSGIDFFNGQLYLIDNGTGTFWIMDVDESGMPTGFAEGFENGKRIRFRKDADNPKAAGPDTEGITVDGNGFVYAASERDNSAKGVNFNEILMVDPRENSSDLIAIHEWDLTASLPQVSANMGIEAVQWVSAEKLNGKLFDKNTNEAFNIENYPMATANGVFFVALEDNGHVYAYILNSDETVVQIADIDSKIGGAMSLDYDDYEDVLWVAADNGYGLRMAKLTFNGKENPDIVHVKAAKGTDVNKNYEGFAIADASFTVDGMRPVYRFEDGVKSGALLISKINCDYVPENKILMGDVNGDGSITIVDATLVQKIGIGYKIYESCIEAAADVNNDGRISILDVTLIQKYIAKGYKDTGLTGKYVEK